MFNETIQYLTRQGTIRSSEYLPSVDSTNSHATRWLGEQTDEGTMSLTNLPRLIITDQQTNGRGRLGNQWQSCDDGLTLSLIVPMTDGLMSIAAGIAVAKAVESLANLTDPCGLKWPNDVWIHDQKVAGILIECVHGYAVIGVGVNVASKPSLDDVPITSVEEASGDKVSSAELLKQLVQELVHGLREAQDNPSQVVADYRQRCVLTGQQVTAHGQDQPIAGQCLGIDDQGHLRIQSPGGVQTCQSGEVQRIRPGTW